MQETWQTVLFWSAFVTVGITIAVGRRIVLGTMAHAERHDPNAIWAVISSHYRHHMIAVGVLYALVLCPMIAAHGCSGSHRQPRDDLHTPASVE